MLELNSAKLVGIKWYVKIASIHSTHTIKSPNKNSAINMEVKPTTLRSIFELTKNELAQSLTGLRLPKDSEKVQHIITDYLNKVCDEENEYCQNLTQSEDYILQAALSMLNAQRDLVVAFDATKIEIKETIISQNSDIYTTKQKNNSFPDSTSATGFLIGAGGGALIGKLIFGGWGAVFGALAGTAVAIYISSQTKSAKTGIHGQLSKPEVIINDIPLNVEALLSVIGQICGSLDNLIETFRAQIRRVVNKYESQEKPTIEREYRILLEGIQSLIGYKRGHSPEEEKYLSRLQTRIEDLAELLDNYDLEAVDYSPEGADWFETIESKNTTEPKMVNPAIIKNGQLILKGKIFIPTK
ncbi:MAG: hypothetical protein K2K84_06775 [Muribaculaceae bacterium]|nr:hypothetical protein [Muribaculaceae bacterium]